MSLPYALLYGNMTTRISSCARRMKSGDANVLPLKHKVLQFLLADSGHLCLYDADIILHMMSSRCTSQCRPVNLTDSKEMVSSITGEQLHLG